MGGQPGAPRFDAPLMVGRRVGGSFGVACDFSVSGMRVRTSDRPPVGSRHEVFFIWDQEEIGCTAEVVRHWEEGIAVRFIEPDAVLRAVLEDIARESPAHGSRDPDYRGGGQQP